MKTAGFALASRRRNLCLVVLLLVRVVSSERPERDGLEPLSLHDGGSPAPPSHLSVNVKIDVSQPGGAVKTHVAQAPPQHSEKATDSIVVPDAASSDSPKHQEMATDGIVMADAASSDVDSDVVPDAASSGQEMATDGIVMADAGSSGTKLFSFNAHDAHTADGRSMKVLSRCSVNSRSKVLEGVSALSYGVAGCDHEVQFRYTGGDPDEPYGIRIQELVQAMHPDDGDLETDEGKNERRKASKWVMHQASDRLDFAPLLLHALKMFHEFPGHCGKENPNASCPPPSNGHHIPLLATAGMRHLTKEQDHAIWGKICGVSISPHYRFAERGVRCGTIPGTQEAFYEFLANIVTGHESTARTGTFTIGGKSAQIAIPLMSREALEGFQKAVQEVNEFMGDCSNIRLPNGEAINILSPTNVPCSQDFIKVMSKGELLDQLPKRVVEKGQLSDLEGLGLVSFLGLFRLTGGVGIAGGSASIAMWARATRPRKGTSAEETSRPAPSCGPQRPGKKDDDYDFDACKKQFLEELQTDKLFQAVKTFFHGNYLQKEDFVYSVSNAIPHLAFLDPYDRTSEDAIEANRIARELEDMEQSKNNSQRLATGKVMQSELETLCEKKIKNMPFGFHKEKSCMQVLFASLYITEFFTEGEDVRLHFESETWSSGLAAEEGALLELGPSLSAQMDGQDAKYLTGAAIMLEGALPRKSAGG